MFGYKLYKITGTSMRPTLSKGDVVVLRRRKARTGDIVLVDHAKFGPNAKRIGADGRLIGDDPNSTSSAELGDYDPATLIGVALIAITPSGIRRLSGRRSGTRA